MNIYFYTDLETLPEIKMSGKSLISKTNNVVTLEVTESDSSYRYRALMQKPRLYLKFSLPAYIEIPIGAWCEYMGQEFTLNDPADIKKHGTRNIEYSLTMGTEEDLLGMYKLRNSVDGRLKYSMCATPRELLGEIIASLNEHGSGVWTIGSCIDAVPKTVEFNHSYLDAALQSIADEFETEWEIINKQINLCKVEHYKSSPVALSYGKGNGFVPGITRSTDEDERPIKRLYVQGGERNIDRSTYGSMTLLLPKNETISYDGTHFSGETGFDSSNARTYRVDADGLYIERYDVVSDAVKEDSLDLEDIYPSWIGTVSSVETEQGTDSDGNPVTFYDILDTSIPAALDFSQCSIMGEVMTIIFQTGMLAGREFDIQTDKDGNLIGYVHSDRRFKLVPSEQDGFIMPGDVFVPAVGDKYAVFNCTLPSYYIEKAETDMLKEAVRYLYDHEDQKFVYNGTLQGMWTKENWASVGGYLIVGSFIHISDPQFAPDGADIRIIGIKDYLTSPYSPVIEISKSAAGMSLSSKLAEIEAQEVVISDMKKDMMQYTKRRWRDAKETSEMLEALVEAGFLNFTESINPITVQTMQLLVGDESLQFRFVNAKTGTIVTVDPEITYNTTTKQVIVNKANILQHMTLGIATVSSNHKASEYKFWDIRAFTSNSSPASPTLSDPSKKYYLYCKVYKDSTNGFWMLSETPVALETTEGQLNYYNFLAGILNSEYDGVRSFVPMYGFTEILPGRITVDKIQDPDATTVFDLTTGTITGVITLQSGSSGLANLSEWAAQSAIINGLVQTTTNMQTQIDGKVETFYQSTDPSTSWTTDAIRATHVGDIWYNSSTQLVYRYQNSPYQWTQLTDAEAAQAKSIAEGKNTVFMSQPSNYSIGDLWVLQSDTTVNGTLYKAGEVLTATSASATYNAAHWTKKVYYDHTQTVIDGGIITSGTIQLAGDNNNIMAGITGDGTASTSIRIWAGATFLNRANAPFRVTQAGTMYATDAIVEGQITATSGSIGGFTITNGWLKSDSNATINNDVGYIQMGSPTGTYEMTFGRNLQPKTIATIYNGSIGENPSTFSYDKSTLICRIRNNNNASASGVLLPKVNVALDINVSANPLTGTNYGRAIAINAIGDIVDYGRQLFWNKVYYTTSTETLTEYYSAVVAQPSSAITLTLPDLSGTSAFYFGDGDGYTYKGLFTIRIIASRWATATTTITGTSSCPLINQYNGSNISVSMTAGQVFDFCYYNGSWYCHKSASV